MERGGDCGFVFGGDSSVPTVCGGGEGSGEDSYGLRYEGGVGAIYAKHGSRFVFVGVGALEPEVVGWFVVEVIGV